MDVTFLGDGFLLLFLRQHKTGPTQPPSNLKATKNEGSTPKKTSHPQNCLAKTWARQHRQRKRVLPAFGRVKRVFDRVKSAFRVKSQAMVWSGAVLLGQYKTFPDQQSWGGSCFPGTLKLSKSSGNRIKSEACINLFKRFWCSGCPKFCK